MLTTVNVYLIHRYEGGGRNATESLRGSVERCFKTGWRFSQGSPECDPDAHAAEAITPSRRCPAGPSNGRPGGVRRCPTRP